MSLQDNSAYIGVFLDEAKEQLALLESDVLKMEKGDHSQEILQTLFRAAHTLKGASRTMGFMEIGNLTHEMENVLDALRHDQLTVTPPIIDALLDCLDALGLMIDAVSQSGSDATDHSDSIAELVTRVNLLQNAGASEPEVAVSPAASTKLEVSLSDSEKEEVANWLEKGFSVFRVEYKLVDSCQLKAVRSFMVNNALAGITTTIASFPEQSVIESDTFDGNFCLFLATKSSAADITKEILDQSELESATAVEYEPESSSQPSLVVEAPFQQEKKETPAVAAVAAPTEPKSSEPAAQSAQTIRVDVQRLDALLNLVGELVTDRTQISRLVGAIRERHGNEGEISSLSEALGRVSLITTELQEEVMKTRMLPIDGVFQRMPRMVRDLAKKTNKEVELTISGGETELDRSVLEALGDPLIHILRNSIDHALESPEERVAAGKPKKGVVSMAARYEESHIVVEVLDDGRGINPETIRAVAVKKGLLTEAAAAALSDRDAINLIMASGFSTAKTISDISGRGVGMDIVKSSLEKIGGRILIDSKVGIGTKISIHLPLTLAIVRALLVVASEQQYVIPLTSVVEMLRLGDENDEVTQATVGGEA
ncbi:MAG TPA: chemotaxis protein CheA, partial [Fimbriimonas sp.]|nr:chemotaxis protein CheA [Fimbriimonas sp.]